MSWWVGLAVIVAGIVAIVRFGQRQQLVPPEDLVPHPASRDRLDAVGALIEPSATIDRAATLAAVDEAMVQLRGDAEPRTAVRLAYATVAQGLGRGGVGAQRHRDRGRVPGSSPRSARRWRRGWLCSPSCSRGRLRPNRSISRLACCGAGGALLERIRVAVADRSTVPGRAGRTD